MSIPTVTWNEDNPAGTAFIREGDDRIRELKTQVREVIDVDHDFPSSGQAADVGQHKQVTLQEQADLGTGAVSATILGSQTVDGKGELVYTDEDDNDIQITNAGELAWESILERVYPIGFVVTLGVSTNPATLFGIGTWTAIAGKVIVGINAGDAEFDTLDETGGAKTVTLTAAQSGLPSHLHSVGIYNRDGSGAHASESDGSSYKGAQDSGLTGGTNASEAHTNLQPYIVKYVWQRTA